MSKMMGYIMERNEEIIDELEDKLAGTRFNFDNTVEYLMKNLIATDRNQCVEIVQNIEDKLQEE